jgi:Ca2+-binding RTX toxin-like protein
VTLIAGQPVTWTYEMTNTGNVTLDAVAVVDDNGTPDDGNAGNGDETLDDFNPDPVNETDSGDGGDFNIGDLDKDNELDPGETWTYEATGTAQALDYQNTATVTANDPSGTEVTDDDTSSYTGRAPLVVIEGSPQFNFPNDVSKIQPKLGGGDAFTLNLGGYIYWDIYTSDATLAGIDTSSGSSPYGFDVDIVEIWTSGNEAVYRIIVTNEDPAATATLANNTNIVEYTVMGDNTERGRLDLVNADPIIGNFNSFNNIENALTKALDDWDTGDTDPTPVMPIDQINFDTVTATSGDDKIWPSSNLLGTGTGESPPDYDDATADAIFEAGTGDDLVYGVNNTGTTASAGTLDGDGGVDAIDGRDGDDVINGGDGDDFLWGGLGADAIDGGDGDDVLVGSYGANVLTGGAGADTFILNVGEISQITDFDSSEGDKIWISTFNGGAALDSDDFLDGVLPADPSDLVIYDAGALYFNPDGAGGDDPILIAVLTGDPDLVAGDIYSDLF